ncbi:hypothetical protein GCM10027416_05220 [Okibacterium endophyticum]
MTIHIETGRARSMRGTAQLGTGLAVASAILIGASLWRFVLNATAHPLLWLSIAAWVLLLVIITTTTVVARRGGYILSSGQFFALAAALAAVVALDLTATSGSSVALYPTAAVAVGSVLMGVVTLRPVQEVLTAVIALAVVLTVGMLVLPGPLQTGSAVGVQLLVLAVGPACVACAIVASYRRMVMMAIDRVLIQSTVTAPAFGVSLADSEELQELDREVEQLFDDVASGREPLPLSSERAAQAADLATALRLTLVAGRNHTWLHHAVNESDFLASSVTLHDPQANAALLDQSQRDGLLSALWLMMHNDVKNQRAAVVTFDEAHQPASGPHHDVVFSISIDIGGLRRVDVDPATWDHLGRVGSYVDTASAHAFHVEIECTVVNPADR